jgi:hypothetical protein
MAYQRKNTRVRVANPKKKKSGFDKTSCRRIVVTFDAPGLQQLEAPDVGIWVEWIARPDVVGPDRRAFIGRKGDTDPGPIMQRGDQVPRRGVGCNLTGRRLYVLGPGEFHIWRPEVADVTRIDGEPVWAAPPGTVAPGLPEVNDGNDTD